MDIGISAIDIRVGSRNNRDD